MQYKPGYFIFLIKKRIIYIIESVLAIFPLFRLIIETRDTQTPIKLKHILSQKILGINKGVYWPIHSTSLVHRPDNILIGIETSPGYMPGCYIQAESKIIVGDYTQIGPGVGLISTNHLPYDNRINVDKGGIKIGKYCWLGMGAKVLSGVELGDFTIVGAGAVVTKSFPDGYCVIAGNPAILIKELSPSDCLKHKSKYEYIGFFPVSKFNRFKQKYLNHVSI